MKTLIAYEILKSVHFAHDRFQPLDILYHPISHLMGAVLINELLVLKSTKINNKDISSCYQFISLYKKYFL